MDYGTLAVRDKPSRAALDMHDLRDPNTVHDNLQASECGCRKARNGREGIFAPTAADQPKKFTNVGTGPACANCGNITVLQGACWLCQTCGSSTGCG